MWAYNIGITREKQFNTIQTTTTKLSYLTCEQKTGYTTGKQNIYKIHWE